MKNTTTGIMNTKYFIVKNNENIHVSICLFGKNNKLFNTSYKAFLDQSFYLSTYFLNSSTCEVLHGE